jgi:3-oxoacyl-[acyl-carrier protein] reductase
VTTALVTGAGGGIGRAICRRLAAGGATVIAHDLSGVAAAETLTLLGSGAHRSVAGDITDPSCSEAAVGDSPEPVSLMVHAAGVDHTEGDGHDQATDPLTALTLSTDDAWRRMQAIHVDGAFFVTRAVVRRLLEEQPGSLVYRSSITGTAGFGPVHYATAKAALLGLTRAVARAGAGRGIRANALAPGMVDSPMTESLSPQFLDQMRARTPLGRLGTVDEIADAAAFLLSDRAGFITGQVLSPNGGLVIA